ncbi:MAG: hypothetical protein NVSMB65_11310 [Chloroflexota bacterium]
MSKVTTESRRERRATERGGSSRRRARDLEEARRRRNRLLMGLTAVLLILIVGGAVIAGLVTRSGGGLADPQALRPAASHLPVGSKAPDFTLSTVDGKSYRLSSLRGKAVLLEFFAVWCPHCQAEAPALERLSAAYKGRAMQVLAVLANPYGKNYDVSAGTDLRLADKSDINWFEQTFAVSHPTLIDPAFTATNRYGASSYPTTYIINRGGTIRFVSSGEIPYATLAAQMDKALRS